MQQSWLQLCKRVARADKTPSTIRAIARLPKTATAVNSRLPLVIMLATLRPAVLALAEPPQPNFAATGQLLCVNAAVYGGVELSIDIWHLILQKPAL